MPSSIDARVWRQHVWRNRFQSLVLLLVMGGFLALLGWLFWGRDGLYMLLLFGLFSILFNPSLSPRLVMRLYGATPIRPDQAPALWRIVDELAARAGLGHRPELYHVPTPMLNAFAVGTRERAAIAVTDGLIRGLDLRELAGVLAHETSHIRNNDLWVMGLADLFSRGTSLLSLMGQFLLLFNLPLVLFGGVTISWFAILLLVFAPNLSALAQLALSRTREYDADLGAAWLTGDPDGLASALRKIDQVQGGWLERIFLPGRREPVPSVLRTHPPTEERIARLMELKPQLGHRPRYEIEDDIARLLDAFADRHARRPPRWHINGLWY